MSRRDWKEAHVRSEDHLLRVVAELVHDEIQFDVRPEPDGWWRIRADVSTSSFDVSGLNWFVQHTRIVA